MNRRRFLKLGLTGATLAVGAGLGLRWLTGGSAPEIAGLQVLSARQYRTFQAVATTHLPQGGPFPQGAQDFDFARLFDGFLHVQPAADQREACLALDLVEAGPVLFDRGTTTFSHLDDAARLRHWQTWGSSENAMRREVFGSLSRFLGMAFYDQPAVWPAIGYQGPSYGRLGRKA